MRISRNPTVSEKGRGTQHKTRRSVVKRVKERFSSITPRILMRIISTFTEIRYLHKTREECAREHHKTKHRNPHRAGACGQLACRTPAGRLRGSGALMDGHFGPLEANGVCVCVCAVGLTSLHVFVRHNAFRKPVPPGDVGHHMNVCTYSSMYKMQCKNDHIKAPARLPLAANIKNYDVILVFFSFF